MCDSGGYTYLFSKVEIAHDAEAELAEQVGEVVAVHVHAVAELLDVVVELHVREVHQNAALVPARAVQLQICGHATSSLKTVALYSHYKSKHFEFVGVISGITENNFFCQ